VCWCWSACTANDEGIEREDNDLAETAQTQSHVSSSSRLGTLMLTTR
jgi:hypothetical protein